VVRDAAQADEGERALRRVAGLAVLVCVLASLGACRSAHERTASAARPSAIVRSTAVQSADCASWRASPPARQHLLLASLGDFFGAPVDGADTRGRRGPVLTTDQASQLFDSYCGQAFAGAFKLYKIYGRAAAFTSTG
jgi:hypothetical protein